MAEVPRYSVTKLIFSLDLVDSEPKIIVTAPDDQGGRIIGRYGTDVQHIFVPLEAGSIDAIVAIDVIEHVLDEQVFLAELARLLRVGGRLDVRVPADGLTGWLDALTIYRYVTDIAKRGTSPRETKPTGWHRHYTNRDIVRLVTEAGLDVSSARQVNPGLAELPHLAGLVIGDFALGIPEVETRLHRWRLRFDERGGRIPAGPLGTRHALTAYRT